MPLDDCKIIDIPRIFGHQGNIGFIEGGNHIPFDIKRVYYLFDVQSGTERDGQASRTTTSLIVAVNGSFDVSLSDGRKNKVHHLNLPSCGLLIPPMTWKKLGNFSSGAVCMVLASTATSESGEITRYDEFLNLAS